MSTDGKSKRYKKEIFMRHRAILFISVIEAQRRWEMPCGNKRLRRRWPLSREQLDDFYAGGAQIGATLGAFIAESLNSNRRHPWRPNIKLI
jgi:hypothetical protein